MAESITRARSLTAAIAALSILVLFAGCGSAADPTATALAPTSPPATEAPPATPTTPPDSTETAPRDTSPPTPTTPSEQEKETPAPSATPETGPASRSAGEYDGISFIVSTGSEATFTVEEQLARLPLPNDAVLRTTALSGEVHLDGRPSVIRIDLQKLSSDQSFRDSYVRNRMFGQHPIATFTMPDVGPVPDGLASGEEVMSEVSGSLDIRGNTFTLGFEVEARDDGDTVYILGRTTFTWDQLEIPRPTARSVASIEDEVRVEILLAVVPRDA